MLSTIVDEAGDKLRKEFTPRQMRTCTTVVWNPVLKNVFAAGLDKVRHPRVAFLSYSAPYLLVFENLRSARIIHV
jgi:hypothetical protein